MPSEQNFDFENDLDRNIPRSVKAAMGEVVLSWAHIDGGLAAWVSSAFNLRPDYTGIMLGTTTNKAKLEKLLKLFTHTKQMRIKEEAKQIGKGLDKYSRVRNAICHMPCIGVRKGRRDTAVFLPFAPSIGHERTFEVIFIDTDEMRLATNFAKETKARLLPILMDAAEHDAKST